MRYINTITITIVPAAPAVGRAGKGQGQTRAGDSGGVRAGERGVPTPTDQNL